MQWIKTSERLPENISPDHIFRQINNKWLVKAEYVRDHKANNIDLSKLEWLEEISSPVLPNKEVKNKEDDLQKLIDFVKSEKERCLHEYSILDERERNNKIGGMYEVENITLGIILQKLELISPSQFKPSNKEGGQEEAIKEDFELFISWYTGMTPLTIRAAFNRYKSHRFVPNDEAEYNEALHDARNELTPSPVTRPVDLIETKNKEIERLKGLIEKAFDAHNIWTKGKDRYNDNWKAFKTENNL